MKNAELNDENAMQVRNTLMQIFFLNFIVAAVKIILGIFTGALSIFSDGVHSAFDGLSNVIGLLGIKFAAEPSDVQHPYGHKKFELIATIGITSLLVVTSVEIVEGAIRRLHEPVVPQITPLTFGLMIFTIAVNIFVTRYEHGKGVALNSLILVADAAHTRSDVMVSFGVLAGMYGIAAGYPAIDPVVSLLVLGAIMKTAMGLFKGASRGLLDEAILGAGEIEKIGMRVPGVRKIHHVRTRGTSNYVFLDACMHVEPSISINKAHRISHNVKTAIQKKFPQVRDVMIHAEPVEDRCFCR